MRRFAEDELPRVPTIKSPDDADIKKQDDPVPSKVFWERIKWLHERGLWAGDYKETPVETHKLNKGPHYFVIEDPKSGSIKCISCSIAHGGILEARMLYRYRLESGVLYFDDKPINETPENFHPAD